MIGWIGRRQKRGLEPPAGRDGEKIPPLAPDVCWGGIWTALQHFRVDLATLVLFLGRNTTLDSQAHAATTSVGAFLSQQIWGPG